MMLMVRNGTVRDGMTSRSGIMQIFYEIADFRFQNADLFQNADFTRPPTQSAVCNQSEVCNPKSAVSCRGRLSGADALDHAPEIVVADGLAVLAHRNHRVIHLCELVDREHQPELLGAALDRMTA